MFERVIAQTIQKISNGVLRERSTIPLVDILEEQQIPARFKPFFETEVRWWLYTDAMGRASNKRFDYDHPELASLMNYMEQVQMRHARFEREEFLAVLDSAVKLTYNYLCRPQTTLKWYVFRGQPVKPLAEVTLRMGAFLDFPYFAAVFDQWVERKRTERPSFDAISASEFERIIRRIDDQILLSCTVEDLLTMMNPLFEFIGEGDALQVPIDSLIIFFDDKNIKRLVDHLERAREEGVATVSHEEFVGLLDELLTTSDDNPEADFSNVYQNDELDDVVRMHLQSGGQIADALGEADMTQPELDRPVEPAFPATRPEGAFSIEADTTPVEMPQPEPETVEATPEEPVLSIDTADDDGEEDLIASNGYDAVSPIESRSTVSEAPPTASWTPTRLRADAHATLRESVVDVEEELQVDPYQTSSIEEVEAAPESNLQEEDAWLDVEIAAAESSAREEAERDAEATEAPASEPEAELLLDDDVEEPVVAPTPEVAPVEESRSMPDAEAAPVPAATIGRPELGDVRGFIDAMLERKLVKKVFARNREEYEAALDRLNQAESWRAASQVLDEIFVRHNVDPYSRTALRFTDSVYGRFLPKTGQ